MAGVIATMTTIRRAAPAAAAVWRISHRLLGPRWAKVAMLALATGAVVVAAATRHRELPGQAPADPSRR